jgi:hypothetical protein
MTPFKLPEPKTDSEIIDKTITLATVDFTDGAVWMRTEMLPYYQGLKIALEALEKLRIDNCYNEKLVDFVEMQVSSISALFKNDGKGESK